jgi:hypothetical protein
VGFEVLMVVGRKMVVFWIEAPCSLVEFTDISDILPVCVIICLDWLVSFSHTDSLYLSTQLYNDGGSKYL